MRKEFTKNGFKFESISNIVKEKKELRQTNKAFALLKQHGMLSIPYLQCKLKVSFARAKEIFIASKAL